MATVVQRVGGHATTLTLTPFRWGWFPTMFCPRLTWSCLPTLRRGNVAWCAWGLRPCTDSRRSLPGRLGMEKRILTEGVMDGFIPGEGAAFVALALTGPHSRAKAAIIGTGVRQDAGHVMAPRPPRARGSQRRSNPSLTQGYRLFSCERRPPVRRRGELGLKFFEKSTP